MNFISACPLSSIREDKYFIFSRLRERGLHSICVYADRNKGTPAVLVDILYRPNDIKIKTTKLLTDNISHFIMECVFILSLQNDRDSLEAFLFYYDPDFSTSIELRCVAPLYI